MDDAQKSALVHVGLLLLGIAILASAPRITDWMSTPFVILVLLGTALIAYFFIRVWMLITNANKRR